MPDGDIIHSGLGYLYQKPYKWLCEGKASSQECARAAMQALLKDIKRKGNEPIKLAKQMGATISKIINDVSKNGVVNWGALSERLERLAQQTGGSHNIKELVLSAAKEIVHDLRYQKIVGTNNLSIVAVERYIQKVYKSNFEERIPLTNEHHAGIDANTLTHKIQTINPEIVTTINLLAKKVSIQEDTAKWRLPKRSKKNDKNPIDMEENLL